LEPDHTAREIANFEGNIASRLSFITPTKTIHEITPKDYGLVLGGANIWTAFAALALKGYKNYKNFKLHRVDSPLLSCRPSLFSFQSETFYLALHLYEMLKWWHLSS
jgi:hypothetical protein